jgi:copper chaperone CopZ
MKKLTLELPIMYADHHVMEVRRLLLEIPGVAEVYASSCFQIVEVAYDPERVNDLQISQKLDEAGYLGEWTLISEEMKPVEAGSTNGRQLRKTAVYEQLKDISFTRTVNQVSRPLWPCPGMGVIKGMDEED